MGWVDEYRLNEFGTLHQQCTGKTHYSTRKRAKAAAKRLTADYGTPMHWYKCRICTRYHLTREKRGTP